MGITQYSTQFCCFYLRFENLIILFSLVDILLELGSLSSISIFKVVPVGERFIVDDVNERAHHGAIVKGDGLCVSIKSIKITPVEPR